MQHTVRLARIADRAAVEEIVQAAYEPWVARIGTRPEPMGADYGELIAAGRVHVACSDDATAPGAAHGLIVLIPEKGALLVQNIAVRPQLHRQGIGRALLAFAEEHVRRLDLPTIRLYAHEKMTSNINLYEAIGYTQTGSRAVPGGRIVLMAKSLG